MHIPFDTASELLETYSVDILIRVKIRCVMCMHVWYTYTLTILLTAATAKDFKKCNRPS